MGYWVDNGSKIECASGEAQNAASHGGTEKAGIEARLTTSRGPRISMLCIARVSAECRR